MGLPDWVKRAAWDPTTDIEKLAYIEQHGWVREFERLRRAGDPIAAQGIFYQDSLAPFATADYATITLSTTSLMLWPAVTHTSTSGGGFWWPGKKMHLRCYGKFTSAATPGNLTVEIRYGTTDNAGTILATSAALTWIASQANMTWRLEAYIQCRAVGTSGSLQATGVFECNTAAIAVGQALLPASAPAPATVDLSVASGLNVQMKRSGSTAETSTVVDMIYASLN